MTGQYKYIKALPLRPTADNENSWPSFRASCVVDWGLWCDCIPANSPLAQARLLHCPPRCGSQAHSKQHLRALLHLSVCFSVMSGSLSIDLPTDHVSYFLLLFMNDNFWLAPGCSEFVLLVWRILLQSLKEFWTSFNVQLSCLWIRWHRKDFWNNGYCSSLFKLWVRVTWVCLFCKTCWTCGLCIFLHIWYTNI